MVRRGRQTVHYSPLTIHHSLLTIHYALLTTHYSRYFGGGGSSIASSAARTVKKVSESTKRAICAVS